MRILGRTDASFGCWKMKKKIILLEIEFFVTPYAEEKKKKLFLTIAVLDNYFERSYFSVNFFR